MPANRNPKFSKGMPTVIRCPSAPGLRTTGWAAESRGFTLIEMLLAVAICAIVLLAVNGVFATAVRLRDRTSEAVEEARPVNRALDTLYRDLKATVGPGGFLAGDFKCGVQAVGATMGL